MDDLPKLEGLWWFPDHVDDKLPGRLVAEDGSARLVLTVGNRDALPPPQGDLQDYEVIHGRTSRGELVSLLKCFDVRSSWSSSGIGERVILANFVLVGGLVPRDKVDTAFGAISLSWPSLKRWFLRSGVTHDEHEEGWPSFTLSYIQQPPIEFEYAEGLDIAFEFGIDQIPLPSPLSEKIEFREVVRVELSATRPRSLRFFLSRLDELVHFFSLCIHEYSPPESVTLLGDFDFEPLGDGGTVAPRLRMYCSSDRHARSDSPPHPLDMLLPFSAIEAQFQDVLRSWYGLAQKIEPVRSLFFSSLYGRRGYLESTFLSLAQAAEVFHRRIHGGTYLPKEDYDIAVRPRLEGALPEHLDGETREVYKSRLGTLNQYSLAARLKAMSGHHDSVLSQFIPDWKKKFKAITKARNHYTHYSESQGSVKPDFDDLVEYREILSMLLELEMLRASGVEPSVLHERACQCQRYRSLVFRRKGK